MGLRHFNNHKSFSEQSNDIDAIFQIIEEYNSNKRLVAFDDMITNILSNKVSDRIIYQRQKIDCFYYKILFYFIKNFQAKFYRPFCY